MGKLFCAEQLGVVCTSSRVSVWALFLNCRRREGRFDRLLHYRECRSCLLFEISIRRKRGREREDAVSGRDKTCPTDTYKRGGNANKLPRISLSKGGERTTRTRTHGSNATPHLPGKFTDGSGARHVISRCLRLSIVPSGNCCRVS